MDYFHVAIACLVASGITRQLTPAVDLTKILLEEDNKQPSPGLKSVNVQARDYFFFTTVKIERNHYHCDMRTESHSWSFGRYLSTGGHDGNLYLFRSLKDL